MPDPDEIPQTGSVHAPVGSVHVAADVRSPRYVLDAGLQGMLPSKDIQWARGRGSLNFPDKRLPLMVSGTYLQTGDGIGDVRISATGKMANTASFITKQSTAESIANSIEYDTEPYPPQKFDFWGRTTYPIEKLYEGEMTKAAFEAKWHAENGTFAWIIRVIALCAMIGAWYCCFYPISVSADLIRYIDNIPCLCGLGAMLDGMAQFFIGLIAASIGCSCCLLVFAVSWCMVHPTTSLIVLVVFCLLIGVAVYILKTRSGKQAAGREFLDEEGAYVKMAGWSKAPVGHPVKVQPMA